MTRFAMTLGMTLLLASGCQQRQETRDVLPFSRVENQTDAELRVSADDRLEADQVEITCERAETLFIKTQVDDSGTLTVNGDTDSACQISLSESEVNRVVVTGDGDLWVRDADLDRIAVNGNGFIDIRHAYGDELDVGLNGTGEALIHEVAVDALTVTSGGTGFAQLGGATADANMVLTGTADFDAEDLITDDLEVDLSGSSSGIFTAVDAVGGFVDGSASLTLHVEDDTDVDIEGDGELTVEIQVDLEG